MADRVSASLIVKNEPQIERFVESIRPHVDEIVIVDTGSTDGTAELAAKLADRFESFTACNFGQGPYDDGGAAGEIADFSMARNRALELASHRTVLWGDADDLAVLGIERLAEAIEWCHANSKGGQPWRARFPYEYDHDRLGRCIAWQLRERIVHPKEAFGWLYRVHEGLTARQQTEWLTLDPPQPLVWRHNLDPRKPRAMRNLRILRDVVRRAGVDKVDLKTVFDLGMAFAKAGDHMKALGWLGKYVATSDVDEDRVLACLQMVDLLAFYPGREQDAAIWAHKAIEIRPDWAEGYWALAKLAYARAARDKARERRHLQRVVHFGRRGLDCEATRAGVTTNPLDRAFNLHAILADASSRLGDYEAARVSASACCAAQPDDPALLLREREFAIKAGTHAVGFDVVIVCGMTAEPWDPWVAAKRGIGGSETAVIEVAKRLVAGGIRVRVFCWCDHAGLYDGVEYRPMGEVDQAAGCDLLIAWRNATLLETLPARVKWLWLHDTDAFGPTPWNLTLADRVLCLSVWHSEHIADKYPAIAERITITRNGIDIDRFRTTTDERVERNPRKAICSSSPDRGLEQMLDIWPLVRERVPDAELHCFYGMTALPKEKAQALRERVDAMPGVVWRDRVDQKTLAREMLSAGVWLHTSWAGDRAFFETSCIGAMEAQAAGLRIVASAHGALLETARMGALIPGDARSDEYRTAFADAVVLAMTASDDGDRYVRRDSARHNFGWDGVAAQWLEMLIDDFHRRPQPRVTSVVDGRPALHMILAPQASGSLAIDARNPGQEAHGGGSRAGFLGLVEAMGRLGKYRVRAFSTFTEPLVKRDDVEYVRLDALISYPDPDIAFAFYDTSPLAHFGPKTFRIASHHTYSPYMHFDSADVNTAPSRHALESLRDTYDPTGVWHELPNAVGDMPIERRPVRGRIVYHTSLDRGLDVLAGAFPAIREAIPDATLHVIGPVREVLDAEDPPGASGEIIRSLRDTLAAAGDGVTLLGRVPRAQLLNELAEASVFAFPCAPVAPCETFSVSVMECCRIGLPVVLAPADALESIYSGAVYMAPAPARKHGPEFARAVVEVLGDHELQRDLSRAGRRLAASFTFERMARVLDSIIHDHARSPYAECAE